MRKTMFFKMAAGNLKKNCQVYLPFILTLTGMAAIFDIMGALAVSPALDFMLGGGFMREILLMGERIVGIFSLIFLFYTNSFLLKRRKKEFGLYHILGMEKRHVALILVLELFYTVLLGLGLGLLAGTVFYKAVLLLLCRILHAPRILGFEFSVSAFTETVVLFGMVFFLLAIYGVRQIFRSETTELLKSNQTAEREPKNRWFLVLVGLVSLGAGYYLAVTIESPLGAIAYFFLAVVLVIIGTYCLFTAGSIFILKMLKKNKGYYYQSRHFTSVSGMLYRMKQNAAGLAGICILSTMVMVTIGASLCIFSGVGEGVREEYPREYFLQMHYSEDLKPETYQDTTSDVKKLVEAQMEENGSRVENMLSYTRCNMVYRKGKDGYEAEMGDLADTNDYENLVYVQYLLREDYEANTGKKTEIPDDVAAFYESEEGLIPGETLLFGDYSIKGKRLEEPVETAVASRYSGIKKRVQVLLPGIEEMEKLTESLGKNFETYYGLEEGEGPGAMYFLGWNWYFDISGKQEPAEEFLEKLRSSWETEKASEWAYISTFQNRTEEEEYLFQEYGTILFIGFFLGMIFLLATVLIIYYKQVTEGYDDRKRFVIMQDIGLSQAEVKKTIRTQVLLVFFLPLGAAGLHMAMAFKVLVKMMALFSAYNIKLFSLCIGLTVAVFALVYFLVYTVTARIYYKIVSNAR